MYHSEFILYLVHFHCDRDYFECHEILEEYWKETEPGKKESVYVGFIQIAVSQYHHRRGNFSGALKTMDKALKILRSKEDLVLNLGLSHSKLIEILKFKKMEIKKEIPYTSFSLPITNQEVQTLCYKVCTNMGLTWGQVSDLTDEVMVHKHTLRDRSEVIKSRLQALNKKRKQ